MRSSVAEWAGEGPPPTIDPDDARRAADEILSRPEYQEPEQSLLDRAVERVFEFAGDLFDRLPGGGPGSSIGWIFVIVLIGAGLWLLVRALRVPRRTRLSAGAEVVYGTEARLDARVWLDEAARLDEVGDHRGAIRCRHQAMVARLVTDGVVDDLPGRTAAEYAARLGAARPDLDQSAATLTATFEAAWYGGAPVDAADYARFRRTAEDVEVAATSGSATRSASRSSAGAPS